MIELTRKVVPCGVAGYAFAGGCEVAWDQEAFSSTGQDADASAQCEVVRSNAMVVAALKYRGPASGAAGVFDRLLDWAKTQHVEAFGPLMGVYQDPESSNGSTTSLEAWLPVDPILRSEETHDPAIQFQDVPAGLVAQTVFRGFPAEIDGAFERLWEFLRLRGLRRSESLHRQVYVQMPPGSPSDSVIEIQLPVETD